MPKAICQPIDNVSDQDEQVVLALIAHLAPSLESWRRGEDLREERALLEQKLPDLQSAVQSSQRALLEVDAELKQVGRSIDIVGSAIGGVVALALTYFIGAIGVLIGFAAIVFASYRYSYTKKVVLSQKAIREQEHAAASENQKKAQSRFAAIDKEMRSRDGAFPETTVSTLAFPIRKTQLVGYDVLVDLSAVTPTVPLSTIDLSRMGSKLQTVSEQGKSVAEVPVLLAPNSDMVSSEALERLYGEEDRLRGLVNGFVECLAEIDDTQIQLPLVNASTEVAQRIAKGALPDYPSTRLISVQSANSDVGRIATFVTQVNAAKTAGERVLAQLRDTYRALAQSCETYAMARVESMNHLHTQLYAVLNRASWCSKRFYCPRTIQSPEYLQALIGVQFEEAHLMPFDDLVERIKGDSTIAQRLDERPEILDLLWNAHRAVNDFLQMANAGGGAQADSRGPIQDQMQENLKEFRIALSRAISGADRPLLSFSREARLFYDPETDEWGSDLLPHKYTTADIQKYGQVLKAHSDLLFPVWDRLWTEKADFRKEELFRTNEAILRMTEKESEKLIEVGNQFRSDMRSVRENVNLVEADLRAKGDEIRQFRNAMSDLNVLSPKQVQLLNDDYLLQLTLGDGSVLERAKQIESWLAFEPKSQVERRGTVRDPIDIARTPDILIGYDVATEDRNVRLLAEGL